MNGAAAGGAFTRDPKIRIVAGAYDYELHHRIKKDGSHSWYLDSALTKSDDHHDDHSDNHRDDQRDNHRDHSHKFIAVHQIRPESGTYLANQAATSMFSTSLHDRAGNNRYMNTRDAEGQISSLWLRQVGRHHEFHDQSGQLSVTGNTYVAQLGGDVAQWSSAEHDRIHLGLMAGYGNSKNNTDNTSTGHASKGSVSGYSVGVYSTWYQDDRDVTGAYLDGQLLYNWFHNVVHGDSVATENYQSSGLIASAEAGYTFELGHSGAEDTTHRLFLEPHIKMTWSGVNPGSFDEHNGTHIRILGDNNVESVVGGRLFLVQHHPDGVSFHPFVEVNWLHNTKRSGVSMNGVHVDQAGATNLGELKLGLEGTLSKNAGLWGNVSEQLGTEGFSNTTAMVGVRYRF